MELPYRPSTTTTIRDRSWWRTFTRDSVRCSGALKAEQTATLPVKNDPLAQTDNLPALGKIDGDQVGGNPTNRCRESRATASTLTHSLRFRRRPRCGLHPDLQLEGPRTLGVTRELKRKKGMHGARSPRKAMAACVQTPTSLGADVEEFVRGRASADDASRCPLG